jgi:hypothetical protein
VVANARPRAFSFLLRLPIGLWRPDALIGVHSTSENGQETLASMGFTTAFARDAAAYGVPPAIVGKIVQTEPGRMEWLSPADLQPMGVVVLAPTSSQSQPLPTTPTAGDVFSTEDKSSGSAEGRAMEAATEFFRSSTLSNSEAVAFLEEIYPPTLTYYGKVVSKEEALRDKTNFMKRYPERAYSIRPGTMTASCEASENRCTVTGMVDWQTRSPTRNATSSGSARFDLTFTADDKPIVLSESSEVLTRGNNLSAHSKLIYDRLESVIKRSWCLAERPLDWLVF